MSIPLPPVRVEQPLKEALEAIARETGRTLSDVIRAMLREAVKEIRV